MRPEDTTPPAASSGAPVPVANMMPAALAALTPANHHRIRAKDAMHRSGVTLEDFVTADVVPACCDEGCDVEPDGRCPHGCPSVLLALGLS